MIDCPRCADDACMVGKNSMGQWFCSHDCECHEVESRIDGQTWAKEMRADFEWEVYREEVR